VAVEGRIEASATRLIEVGHLAAGVNRRTVVYRPAAIPADTMYVT